MFPRTFIKLFFSLTCVVTAVMFINYMHFSPRQYTPVSLKFRNRDSNPTTYSQRKEKRNFARDSTDNGECAIPTAFVNESLVANLEGCKLPNLDPYHPFVMRAVKPVTSFNCTGRLFTGFESKVFRLLDDVKEG